MAVHDTRLPDKWSKGSAGGPEFRTGLVPLASGAEYRPRRWLNPLWRYEIAHNIKSVEQIAELRAFHLARAGRYSGFLLKDWLDYTSAANGRSVETALDQPLGIGTGAQSDFQLYKHYPDSIAGYDRPISWPVTGTLLVAADGAPVASGLSVARGTGIVTISPAPALDVVLTAGFQFDVPVRFDDDWLSVTWDTINSCSAGSVLLQELRGE